MSTEWKCPNFNLSGIPLQEGNFVWAITSGVEPYVGKIVVNKDVSKQISALINPVYINMVLTGGTKGEPEDVSVQFDNLYLIEKRELDEYYDCWFIADCRWLFNGKRLYCYYNKTRTANEKNVATPAAGGSDPIQLRQPFDQFASGRYLAWSISSGTKPYTMSEIIQLELQKLGIFPYAGEIQADYVVENVEYFGVDLYEGLSDLLYRGRLNMAVTPNGEISVYSVDAINEENAGQFTGMNAIKMSPGIIYVQDRKWSRPRFINVQFEKLNEIRLVASSSEDLQPGDPLPLPSSKVYNQVDKDSRPPKVIGCENVIRVPYPVEGKNYKIGEYVPMWEYLKSINLTEEKVRKLWFSDHLYRWYAKKTELAGTGSFTIENERFSKHIISNIKAHYRQVYRIEPYWMDRIEFWTDKRVSVIDNYTRTMTPSPLFSDYCLIPNQRCPIFAKRKAIGAIQAYNWDISVKDPYRVKPTPGGLVVLNSSLGVFKVEYPPLIDKVVSDIIPSMVEPVPYPATTSGTPLLSQSHLTESFSLDTIISVKWSTAGALDQFDAYDKFYRVQYGTDGVAPDVVSLCKLEAARFGVREYNEEGQVIADNIEPVNKSILHALANSETEKVLNPHKNRPYGVVELPGYVGIPVEGHMVGIVYKFDNQDGLTTTVDLRGTPPFVTKELMLSPKQLSYLYKQLPRGDFRNDIGNQQGDK